MKNIKIIPHFHGISFCNDNYNNLNIEQINQNRERIFNLYKNGNVPYYSEMIFKNAFLDPNKELSEYDIGLMEDFYVGEVENVFNNRNIMTQKEFLEFSRHYVNSYEKYIINGEGTYSEDTKEKMENLGLDSNKCCDPFVPTSKFPFHPIKFAISNNKKDEFKEQFKLFKDVNAQYLLLGMVFCSFYSKKEYNQELKHDIPQIKHLKNVNYNYRYLYQTEVDFYKINPQNFKFAFPILLIKNNIPENDKQNIKEKFNLNEDEYNMILQCSPYNRRYTQQTFIVPNTIFDNICENYSKLILRKAKDLLNKNEKLYYLNPINKFVEIEDENKLNDYTNDVHALSRTGNGNGIIVDQQPKEILGIKDLKDRFANVKNDILNIIKEKEDLGEARKLLSEKVSEEKYETVCASRIVSKLANGRNTVEENDAKTAQILQKREDRRYRYMVKKQTGKLNKYY